MTKYKHNICGKDMEITDDTLITGEILRTCKTCGKSRPITIHRTITYVRFLTDEEIDEIYIDLPEEERKKLKR